MKNLLSNLPQLPNTLLQDIAQHAHDDYPNECCGVWLQHADGRWSSRRLHNIAAQKQRAFTLDPLDILDLLEGEDQGRWRWHGVYHSHPDHPPFLSNQDRAHWITAQTPWLPGRLQLIAGVTNGQCDFALYMWSETQKQYECVRLIRNVICDTLSTGT
ncbi:MAG TPA: hypothetical protein DCE42_10135 [Myxococcales bacterium]|nr:hypothetical protein [Deltaproteobacteria bacterium]HAA55108.1 hypothetical protein [Myxococcales bacterium]